MSACVNLLDGRSGFYFTRAPIDGNHLAAGGQEWLVGDPYRATTVSYRGPLLLLDDPWVLTDPERHRHRAAAADGDRPARDHDGPGRGDGFRPGSHRPDLPARPGRLALPAPVLGHRDDTRGGRGIRRLGRGGKDHSWGPRNWLAKIYLRWLIAVSDDDELGFMLVRAVGPTKRTRSGHVWEKGQFYLVDDFGMVNTYAPRPPHELLRTRAGGTGGRPGLDGDGRAASAWVPLPAPFRGRERRTCPAAHRQVARPLDVR